MKSAFQNHSGSIRNTTVALLVFGLNPVVQSEDFFQCPPDNFVFYASCFFIIPALFFFIATIFLHSGFWDHVRGCCYYEVPYKRGAKRYCCCLFPRWPCSKALVEIVFQSSLSGFMWIFWALLQRDYYICAALGGTKAAKLISASAAQKLQIEADYANAGKNSQTAALLLLAGALLTAFVVVSVQRCCYQREFGTLPSPYQYKKLESEAAVENRRAFCMRMCQYGLLKCYRGIFYELFTFSASICKLFSGAETCIGCYVPQTCSLRYRGTSTIKVSLLYPRCRP